MKKLLDIILDQNNKEPLSLQDENGRIILFEQVAVIPHGKTEELNLYVVLKPIDSIEGIADDEAIVFRAIPIEGVDGEADISLTVEEDEETAVQVFEKYYDLLKTVK